MKPAAAYIQITGVNEILLPNFLVFLYNFLTDELIVSPSWIDFLKCLYIFKQNVSEFLQNY